jgi:hypothetical protein
MFCLRWNRRGGLGATTTTDDHQEGNNEGAAFTEIGEEWGAEKHDDLPGKIP